MDGSCILKIEYTGTQGNMGGAKNTFAIFNNYKSFNSKNFICSCLGLSMTRRIREICSNFTDEDTEAWKV